MTIISTCFDALAWIFVYTKRPPDYYVLFVNCHINIPNKYWVQSSIRIIILLADEPPAKKRKRSWTEYEDFIGIISKLGSKYDPALFACIKHLNGDDDVNRNKGAYCEEKWLCSPRRDILKTDKLDRMLRIFINSPGIEETDLLNES